MQSHAIGIDFGTTNSSIARAFGTGETEVARFAFNGALTDSYRSLLYLEKSANRAIESWTGPEGIEHYLAADPKGRLIQSLKSFLTTRNVTGTEVFGRRRTFEDLISRILRDLRTKAEAQFGIEIRSVVAGRPVRFVGAESEEDNAYAESRLRASFQTAGFDSVHFEMEPVAAAHYYESTLDHDELILIGDFGGGTSDFSLIHVGPSILTRGRTPADLLGNAGVGIAGDAFDARIIRHLVSPAFGAGTNIRSIDKILPVPTWIYAKLERWHHLSFLRANEVMSMLHSVRGQALEPKRIDALIHLINEDLGYQLHRSVQQVKFALSHEDTAQFAFSDGSIELNAPVKRASFERWIRDELRQIAACVDSLIATARVGRNDVDMVFLTGGSSFVPAVRSIFEERFGRAKIRAGNEFTSVAQGLALKASALQRA